MEWNLLGLTFLAMVFMVCLFSCLFFVFVCLLCWVFLVSGSSDEQQGKLQQDIKVQGRKLKSAHSLPVFMGARGSLVNT